MSRLRSTSIFVPLTVATVLIGRIAAVGPPSGTHLSTDLGTLVSMQLPHSTLLIQNLEADGPVSGKVVLRHPDGSVADRIPFADIPPLAPFPVELAAVPDLPVGSYSAVISSTGRVAALARHAWPVPGKDGALDLALAGAPGPGRDLVVPYLAFSDTYESAVLAIQNVESGAPAEVDVELIPYGSDSAAWRGSVHLAPSGSALLDLAGRGVQRLPASFQGHARLRASSAVAAMALLVMRPRESPAVAALEAIPDDAATPRLFTSFSTGIAGYPPTEVALVNPGHSAAEVTPVFHIENDLAGNCPQTPVAGPRFTVAPGRGRLYVSGPEGVPGLGAECTGVLSFETNGAAIVGAFVNLQPESVTSLREPFAQAYALPKTPSTSLVMPHIEWRARDYGGGVASVETYVFALNPDTQDTSAWLGRRRVSSWPSISTMLWGGR